MKINCYWQSVCYSSERLVCVNPGSKHVPSLFHPNILSICANHLVEDLLVALFQIIQELKSCTYIHRVVHT